MPITNVYIDGFNLYNGALKGTPYRWLDLEKLCGFLLPGNEIGAIKYFTAKVSARPHDPDQPMRQQLYLRALGTLPKVSVHYTQSKWIGSSRSALPPRWVHRGFSLSGAATREH